MKNEKEGRKMAVLTKPIDRAFVVRADKWDKFLSHKADGSIIARCKRIDALIPDSAKVQNGQKDHI